jgi:hypothetical protein
MAYDFSDWFPPTALSASIASGDTTIQVGTLTSEFVNEVQAGGRFPLRIGRGTAAERVIVTAIADAANNKLTVERGVDGFSAMSHNGGARVAHALPTQQAQAAEAANLQIPEPWTPQDLGAAKGDGELTLSDLTTQHPWRSNGVTQVPGFLLDYENLPAVIPSALQDNHVRSSKATRWDASGNLVEDGAGTLRLQRDPATGEVLGLLYEPKRTQKLSYPTTFDPGATDWESAGTGVNVTDNQGTAKGQPYGLVAETTGDGLHDLRINSISLGADQPVSASAIVKGAGRDVGLILIDENGNTLNAAVNFDNGTFKRGATPNNAALIDRSLEDLENGWNRIKVSGIPESGSSFDRLFFRIEKDDGTKSYAGDGSSGFNLMHAQVEASREVTTPILDGGAVREADEVNYRFDFPDTTTGVAYSIEQQAGDKFNGEDGLRMGTTPDSSDRYHGALMSGSGGLDDAGSDQWIVVTRNSDEPDSGGNDVKDETIDRLEMRSGGGMQSPVHVVRQIAIHTDPHTQAQKSDLESNYLTTP